MGEQTILTSFGDVITILLMHLGIGYKRKMHKSLGAVIWFLELNGWSVARRPLTSTLAISVPLIEQEYIPVELCALFIHLHVPRLITPLVSMTLVVC